MSLDLNKARAELRSTPKRRIEEETADTWAARAIAAWELAAQTHEACWVAQAAAYEHEAIEHAAEAGPGKYAEIRYAITEARAVLGLGDL